MIGKETINFVGNPPLQKEVNLAFVKMQQAARKEGIELAIVSGYRSFDRQYGIWKRKYRQFTKDGLTPLEAIQKIISYSTIPGTSRHHWGTDMDIIDRNAKQPTNVLNANNFLTGGCYEKMYVWMRKYANSFGFYEVYTNEPQRKGFEYEPWHYSYADIALPILEEYQKIDLLKLLQQTKMEGSEYFTKEFVTAYRNENILDINPILLPS